jgi:hypothetical protein
MSTSADKPRTGNRGDYAPGASIPGNQGRSQADVTVGRGQGYNSNAAKITGGQGVAGGTMSNGTSLGTSLMRAQVGAANKGNSMLQTGMKFNDFAGIPIYAGKTKSTPSGVQPRTGPGAPAPAVAQAPGGVPAKPQTPVGAAPAKPQTPPGTAPAAASAAPKPPAAMGTMAAKPATPAAGTVVKSTGSWGGDRAAAVSASTPKPPTAPAPKTNFAAGMTPKLQTPAAPTTASKTP